MFAADSRNKKTTPWATGTVTIDSTPPEVAITDPSSGRTIGGISYPITITATDTLGIDRVAVYVDFTGVDDEPHSIAVYDATSSTYIANLYPHAVSKGPHTITAVAYDTAGNWSDPVATEASINIIVDNVVPNPPINLSAIENPDGTVTLTWEPPTTNEDGSTLTDLAGYNIYSVTEENRCEPIYPVSGDTTPLVCEPGSSQGTFTINGPTLSFDGIDYTDNPLEPASPSAVWLDTTNQDNPFSPLPLNDTTTIDPSKPVFAFLLNLNLTDRTGLTPGEYSITAYTQNSRAEIEEWQIQSIEYGAMIVDSRIIVQTLACANSNLGGFISMPSPFTSIPNYIFDRLNTGSITDPGFLFDISDTSGTTYFTAQSIDGAENESIFSNTAKRE